MEQPFMPETLKLWLESLSEEQANDLSNWLDSEPDALSEMLEIIAESHTE
jgi:hypothetical protein